jgi:uncharacterized peroxidase-related enzyme
MQETRDAMAFVDSLAGDNVSASVSELYQADLDRSGYISNDTLVFARRPDVLAAWTQLIGSIRTGLDDRRFELVTLAAARSLRSSYCSLAHGKVLAEQFYDPDTVRQIAVDHRTANLDPVDVAIMDFAEKVCTDASGTTAEEVAELRDLGLSDDDILAVTLVAAARCFFAKTLDALGTQPDAEYRSTIEPELRAVLAVGRPIAAA